MDIFKIYDSLCQRLLPFNQVNNANMFIISDSKGIIGIKKGNVVIIIIQVGVTSLNMPMPKTEIDHYRSCYPFLRLLVRTDNEGKWFGTYNLTDDCTGVFDIDQIVGYIKKTIIEYKQMNYMVSLPEVSLRNNIESRQFGQKQVIVFDDHRTTLEILYELYRSKQFEGLTPNLITFDFHEDCCDAGDYVHLIGKIGSSDLAETTQRQFWSFTEFDISKADDDWISAAMTLGLVKDVVIIGHQTNSNVNNHANSEDSSHKIYSIGHLSGELGNRGCLGDSMICDSYYEWIRNTIQYHHQRFDSGMIYPFILDIDLDCFSAEVLGHTVAWPESIFFKEYVENQTVYSFMNQLIERASIITISREPACCGGFSESNKILGYLDKYFFQGSIMG